MPEPHAAAGPASAPELSIPGLPAEPILLEPLIAGAVDGVGSLTAMIGSEVAVAATPVLVGRWLLHRIPPAVVPFRPAVIVVVIDVAITARIDVAVRALLGL